jgi:hypothetical protein
MNEPLFDQSSNDIRHCRTINARMLHQVGLTEALLLIDFLEDGELPWGDVETSGLGLEQVFGALTGAVKEMEHRGVGVLTQRSGNYVSGADCLRTHRSL